MVGGTECVLLGTTSNISAAALAITINASLPEVAARLPSGHGHNKNAAASVQDLASQRPDASAHRNASSGLFATPPLGALALPYYIIILVHVWRLFVKMLLGWLYVRTRMCRRMECVGCVPLRCVRTASDGNGRRHGGQRDGCRWLHFHQFGRVSKINCSWGYKTVWLPEAVSSLPCMTHVQTMLGLGSHSHRVLATACHVMLV